MDILYISSASSEKTLEEVSSKYLDGVPLKAPQQTFDFSIATGLSHHTNVNLISIPPVPFYPKSKCIYFPRLIEEINEKIKIEYIPLINLPIIKSICIFIFVFIKILVWNNKNIEKEKFLLLHWPYFPTMLAAYVSKLFTKHKVILTVPDIPSFSITYNKNSKLFTKILIIFEKIKPNLIDKFDGYVLLTKFMREKLNIMDKPYIIIEGLLRKEDIQEGNTLDKKYSEKVIMYAGAVYEKFGIKNLVEAFDKYVTEESELWIYGTGDYVKEIKEYEKINPKIKYKGVKFRTEILDAEKKATLLINPRPTKEEFTKYSFPSKTLEYMGSGTPMLSTKLAGIPSEYKDYIFWIEDESVKGIGEKLNFLMSKDRKYLHEFGIRAQNWVKVNKNNNYQMKKLRDFLIKEYVQNNKN